MFVFKKSKSSARPGLPKAAVAKKNVAAEDEKKVEPVKKAPAKKPKAEKKPVVEVSLDNEIEKTEE